MFTHTQVLALPDSFEQNVLGKALHAERLAGRIAITLSMFDEAILSSLLSLSVLYSLFSAINDVGDRSTIAQDPLLASSTG